MSNLIPVNNQLYAQFFTYIYFYSLRVSGSHVPIVRRIIVSVRHLVYVTLCVWYAGAYTPAYQTVIYTFLFSMCFGQPLAHCQENYCISATPGLCHTVCLVCRGIYSCIPDGHLHISILYVFRAATWPSSGELLYQCDTWFMSLCVSGMQEHILLHTRHTE